VTFVNEKTLATVERVSELSSSSNSARSLFAVAWSLAHDFGASSIIGAARVEQLDEILHASEVKLTVEV
jgi:aryl-alcohol dehydrogenase-like predicted oxidoreductase